MQFECIEKHIFSGISDYFRLFLTGALTPLIQGGPEKMQHLRSMISRKTRDRINKLCALLRTKFFFQQDDTKIINFDEGILILWPFSETMSFSKFASSISKVTTYRKFPIVWLPLVKCLLLLWKTKTAWIKRSIYYVTLQCYNPGKAPKEIPPSLNRDFWYRRSKFWKWHCFRKMALE